MYKSQRLKKLRILANHMLSLSQYNSFPIHLNMEFNAEALFQYKEKTGLSLTAILTKNMAQIFVDHKRFQILNSYLIKSPFVPSRLIVFDHISFSVALPKQYEGEEVASLFILKDVDKKTMTELDNELQAVNQMTIEEMPFFKKLRKLLKIPSLFYSPLFLFFKWFPSASIVAGSSVGLTNLGRSPVNSVFPVSPKTLIFGLGGASMKTVRKNQELVENRHMTLAMTFNHYVVDGVICSEYLDKLKAKLESLA